MVDKVLAKAGSDKISRLNIIGHGGAVPMSQQKNASKFRGAGPEHCHP